MGKAKYDGFEIKFTKYLHTPSLSLPLSNAFNNSFVMFLPK